MPELSRHFRDLRRAASIRAPTAWLADVQERNREQSETTDNSHSDQIGKKTTVVCPDYNVANVAGEGYKACMKGDLIKVSGTFGRATVKG